MGGLLNWLMESVVPVCEVVTVQGCGVFYDAEAAAREERQAEEARDQLRRELIEKREQQEAEAAAAAQLALQRAAAAEEDQQHLEQEPEVRTSEAVLATELISISVTVTARDSNSLLWQ